MLDDSFGPSQFLLNIQYFGRSFRQSSIELCIVGLAVMLAGSSTGAQGYELSSGHPFRHSTGAHVPTRRSRCRIFNGCSQLTSPALFSTVVLNEAR